MSTHNLYFEQKFEKISEFFYLIFFQLLEVKFSIYLNRRVFVMTLFQADSSVVLLCALVVSNVALVL